MIIRKIESEQEWLEVKKSIISASEASRYCGIDHYTTNSRYHYWEEKVGKRQREDISNKKAVRFGKLSEEHIRKLVELILGVEVEYHPFWIYSPDDRPWMGATLDGIIHFNGFTYILEIKTTTRRNFHINWKDGIPDGYLCQISHQLNCVQDANGVIVICLEYTEDLESEIASIHKYTYTRNGMKDNCEFVLSEADEMHRLIEEKIEPKMVVGGFGWKTI